MTLRLVSTILSSSPDIETEKHIRNTLLQDLLDSIKQCQRQFGGKRNLASDKDSCVMQLCYNIELVLSHGLRAIPLLTTELTSDTLRQVSSLITNKLNLTSDTHTLWNYILLFLTKHERERYGMLKNINSDIGRSRAWIRGCLNEKAMERYVHFLLGTQELLYAYYEDWAFLRDHEISSVLPNAAAGLNSILFAINIDNAELNSSSIDRKPYVRNLNSEPIICKPVDKERLKRHNKHVVREITSFDEDDNEFENDVNSILNAKTTQVDDEMNNNDDRNDDSVDNLDDRVKLMHVGGECSYDDNSVNEVLIPITQAQDACQGVEEFPSITVTVPKVEDDAVNSEYVARLLKENETLKSQLRRYVDAITLLKSKNSMKNMTANTNNEFYSQFKHYETKLIQVAEMHGELIEFNDHLQRQINVKDIIIQRLQHKLSTLRGNDEFDDHDIYNINDRVYVALPAAFLKQDATGSYYVYQIYIKAGMDEWNLYKRYSEFLELHKKLKSLDSIVTKFKFPPKKALGNKSIKLIERRRKSLELYLRRVFRHWRELSSCTSRVALEQYLPFFEYSFGIDNTNNTNSAQANVNTRRSLLSTSSSSSNTNSANSVDDEGAFNGV